MLILTGLILVALTIVIVVMLDESTWDNHDE